MKFLRTSFSVLETMSPWAAAWFAERLFFTPPRPRGSSAGRAALASAHRFELRVEGRRIVGWRWGGHDTPTVYLVHGWGSRGSRLAAFTTPLRAAGYSVVTFDAPGHGGSGWGMSSVPEFARTLAAVVEHEGNGSPPAAVIAHSFGCAGTALAVAGGLAVERLVFLAPAVYPPAWVESFGQALHLRAGTLHQMRRRSERRLRFRWSDANVCDIARRVPSPAPLLVVHDQDDERVPWGDGAAIAAAWPGARLITTSGLGHGGVTRDADVVRQAVAFASGRPAPGPWQGTSEAWQLEHDLFYRTERV